MFHWENFLTKWAGALDFNELGIILVVIFVVAWAVALLIWKLMNLSKYEQAGS